MLGPGTIGFHDYVDTKLGLDSRFTFWTSGGVFVFVFIVLRFCVDPVIVLVGGGTSFPAPRGRFQARGGVSEGVRGAPEPYNKYMFIPIQTLPSTAPMSCLCDSCSQRLDVNGTFCLGHPKGGQPVPRPGFENPRFPGAVRRYLGGPGPPFPADFGDSGVSGRN